VEELAVDKRHGFFFNHDFAGYEVPVHADISHQEVVFLDEVDPISSPVDPISSPMKAKGVGELGLCGVGAAVANAIYNATGLRVRNSSKKRLLVASEACARSPARAPGTVTSSRAVALAARLGVSQETSAAN
jgi:hypothetical protein